MTIVSSSSQMFLVLALLERSTFKDQTPVEVLLRHHDEEKHVLTKELPSVTQENLYVKRAYSKQL